jgi:hypothetical protein
MADDPKLDAELRAEFEAVQRHEEEIGEENLREQHALIEESRSAHDPDDELPHDDELDETEEGERARHALYHARLSLKWATQELKSEELTLTHDEAHAEREWRRIKELGERFPDPATQPEAVSERLDGYYFGLSDHFDSREKHQQHKIELAKLRTEYLSALVDVLERLREVENRSRRTSDSVRFDSAPSSRPVGVWLAIVAAVVFAIAGIHELQYAHDHPHAYGPAKVIAWVCGAGLVLSIGVVFAARQRRRSP